MKNKILFLADYFVSDGIMGGAERSDNVLINEMKVRGFDVTSLHTSDIVKLKSTIRIGMSNIYDAIILSNRTRLTRDSMDLVMQCGVPYFVIERDCQFVKSRNVASYRNYTAPPSQINNEAFYNSADGVFALCESHYAKMILNLPKAKLVNLGSTHLDADTREFISTLRNSDKKHESRIGVPKLKDWGNAARYAKLMYPEATIEFFDANPNREAFLNDVATYSKIAFKPHVYESFSRFCLECEMLGCAVLTEKPKDIGFYDSSWWNVWRERGANIDEAYERVERSIDIIVRTIEEVI